MTSLRQVKWERARQYILAHPDQSKEEQSIGADVSDATIARVRAVLVSEGLLAPARNAPPWEKKPSPKLPPETTDDTRATMLDHAALTTLSDMADVLSDNMSDEDAQKRLQKQALLFAFDPKLHPDTRMSASQMWQKLRDAAKAKNLGPGAPKTFEDAVARMSDLMVAVGAQVTLAAVNIAFNVKESADEGKVSADSGATAPSPA